MIYVCADDFGLCHEGCRHIEECLNGGALNKISVFPNTNVSFFPKNAENKKLYLSLHINLVEGKALSKQDDISLLVTDKGVFKYSFLGLLMLSLSGKRKEFEKQVLLEIRAQLRHWKSAVGNIDFMLDSHQHTHMIPSVFRMLMRAIKEEGIKAEYLRIPTEPIIPYLKEISLYHTYRPANIIKQWLLKFLAIFTKAEFEKSGIKTAYFMGILFSGKMDTARVEKILPHYIKLAKKHERDIEVLFHPGYLQGGEKIFENPQKGFEKFYYSAGRKTEYDAVMSLDTDKLYMKEECSNGIC